MKTPVGFAALVHTRCAFVVSGTTSNNSHAAKALTKPTLASWTKQCQALFLPGDGSSTLHFGALAAVSRIVPRPFSQNR